MKEMAGDRRSRVAADRAEDRILPLMRSVENAVIPTNAQKVIELEPLPFTLVLPSEDRKEPCSYLAQLADKSQFGKTLVPPGTRMLPLEDPGAAVLLLDPEATAEAKTADSLPRAKPNAALGDLRAVFASTANTIMWRGFGTLVLGLWILSVRQLNPRLIALAFAVWVGVEGVSTISGAVGLRRTGSTAWLPWFLMGILSFGVAAILLLRTEFTMRLIAIVIAVRALYIGFADLYVARRVTNVPTARWILVLQGLLGVVVGVTVFFSGIGANILQLVLGGYFAISGVSAIIYAIANRVAVTRRVRTALAHAKPEGEPVRT
jgi:uncharacterized membrane protein HdeD (DUF308 family)